MGRLLSIDYGIKRTGIAVTDPLGIIASPLDTILTENLFDWIKDYTAKETVDRFVIGMPIKLDQSDTHTTQPVKQFIQKLNEALPGIPVIEIDERFTSKIAQQSMVIGGMKKKERQKKENIDKISATLILQSYLEQQR